MVVDSSKHRTLEDAIKFGIAGYKGIDMSAVQRDAGVWDGTSKYVSDARFDPLAEFILQEREPDFNNWRYTDTEKTDAQLKDDLAYINEVAGSA